MKRVMALITALLMIAPIVSASQVGSGDSSTPVDVTINYIIPSDTSFTVSLAGAETTIDFDTNVTGKTQTEVYPDSQDATTSIITVQNIGNVNQNISAVLTSANPSWAVLKGYQSNTYGSADTITDASSSFVANDLTMGNTQDYWLWADFVNATGGTTQRTLRITTVETT